MAFKQILINVWQEKIGNNGISKTSLETAEKLIVKEIDQIKAEKRKLFDFSDIDSKTKEIEKIVSELQKDFEYIYVLGTGGATLCGQTICGLQYQDLIKNKVHFVDNIDPKSFEFIKNNINYDKSLILVISKSGGTLETISQFAFFINIFEEKLGKNDLAKHFLVITDTDIENNKIRNIAEKLKIRVESHEKVGGRFSIFSSVSLIPAVFIGLNIKEILRGAAEEIRKTFEEKSSTSITGAALNYLMIEDRKIPNTVMMPYIDRLKNFTTWWAQIWAESLGKNDKASTPIRSLGTLDQHSQLQLYLDGKKDKFFNVMYIRERGDELKINLNPVFKEQNLDFINNKTFANIINAAAFATIETLAKNKSPVRTFEIDKLDEFTMGAICMNFILETVLLAGVWKINAFDQPAVEQGKKLTVDLLKTA